MSLAATAPRGQPPPLLDSTLVWARSTAFASPQALNSATPSSTPTFPDSAATLPVSPAVPALAPLPAYFADEDTICDSIGHSSGLDSDADVPHLGSCPSHQEHPSWVQVDVLAKGPHSEPTFSACHCGECGSDAANVSRRWAVRENYNGEDAGYISFQDGGTVLAARRQAHLHASTSVAPGVASTAAADALMYGGGRRRSSAAAEAGVAFLTAAPPQPATAMAVVSRAGSCGGPGGGPAAAVAAVHCIPPGVSTLSACPSSPLPPPIPPLFDGRASGSISSSGRASSSGGGAAVAAPRRSPYSVKVSAMTSQISAAQRCRAATLIQAAWRGFRIRRLYLRLIVWRRRPPGGKPDTYCRIREFPPIPELPDVSLFTRYGRPHGFRSVKRRVWFGIEGLLSPASRGPSMSAIPAADATITSPPLDLDPASNPVAPLPQPQPRQEQEQQQSAQSQEAATAPQKLPMSRPGPRGPLRLTVPQRAEVDVPMSEVERILAGGFWRVGEERQGAAAAGGGGGGDSRGGGVEGEEGLSLYQRAKMRAEEREAEAALQMLSYEPHDMMQVLGSWKERTLERLGSLGRTIGVTLPSGLLLGASRGQQQQGQGQGQGRSHGQRQQVFEHGTGHWHWHWHRHLVSEAQSGGGQARSLPRGGWLGSSAGEGGGGGGGGVRPRLYCAAPAPTQGSSAGAIISRGITGHGGGGGFDGGGEWSLRMPLLTVVDAEGRFHTVIPTDAVARPMTLNWERYRSRSHVTRMTSKSNHQV